MLFGSNILEVAVGLTFLYVLLALICSALNEWIAGILSLRSKTLREGIANGHHGIMPAHRALLGETRARLAAAYVWSLSHGNAAGAGKPE